MKPKAPCHKCTDRVVDPPCHSTCEKYISFRQALDDYNKAYREERDRTIIIDSYIISQRTKHRRK